MTEDNDIDSFFAELNSLPVVEEPIAEEKTSQCENISTVVEPAMVHPKPFESSSSSFTIAPSIKSHHLPITMTSTVSSINGRGGTSNLLPHHAPPSFSTGFVTTYAVHHQPPPPSAPKPLEIKPRAESGQPAVRSGAGQVWVDPTLNEWPDNDYRIFVGDLAKETSNDQLAACFTQYVSFAKAKVVRTSHDNKSKGYGFVSFLDPMDCAKAIREMNGKYCGARPMKIRKSTWEERDLKEVKKKESKKRKLQESLGL